MVLTSLRTGPSAVRKKSMRATPAQPSASNIRSAAPVRAARSALSMSAGTLNRAEPSYFDWVSNRPLVWISSGGDAHLTQDGHIDLPARDDILDQDPVV